MSAQVSRFVRLYKAGQGKHPTDYKKPCRAFLKEGKRMNKIQIFWNDLTAEKQQEIMDTFGDNCNYDVFPIVEIPVETEEDQGISPQL